MDLSPVAAQDVYFLHLLTDLGSTVSAASFSPSPVHSIKVHRGLFLFAVFSNHDTPPAPALSLSTPSPSFVLYLAAFFNYLPPFFRASVSISCV